MTHEQDCETPKELSEAAHLALRLFVPALYACCAVCLLLDLVESDRRIALAEEVAEALRERAPTSVSELRTVLDGHLDAQSEHRSPSDGTGPDVVSFRLEPHAMLHVSAALTHGTDTVEDIKLIFAASEELPLDRPSEGLPGSSPWQTLILIVAVTGGPSWAWYRATRGRRIERPKDLAGALVGTMPLLLLLPISGLCLLRISF